MSGDANYSPVRAHKREKAAGLAVHAVCSFGEGGTGRRRRAAGDQSGSEPFLEVLVLQSVGAAPHVAQGFFKVKWSVFSRGWSGVGWGEQC